MIRSIVKSSLRLRLLVVAVAIGVMILGIGQLRQMPVDVLPEFAPPTVELQTEALGLSASEVEQMVTVPMEQDLLNGVAWLDQIHSESVPGLSRIQLIFEPGTDLMRARQVVQERLTQAHALPNVSSPPQMLDPVSSTGRVMMIRLSSDTVSPIEMSVLARWVVKPRLLGVNGVANVSIFGQRERQIQVLVDPTHLKAQGVALLDVITAAGNALWVSPLSFLEASTPGTGGFIDTPNQRLSIQHLLPIKNASDLAQTPLDAGEQALRLGDVASVVEDHQPLIGDAVSPDGANDLLFVIEKAPNANTLQVTYGIDQTLEALDPGLTGVKIDTSLYRPASYIDAAAANQTPALLAAGILLALAIGIMLWDWRSAFIGAATIPLALIAATFVLYLRGVTFNAMVLTGLVVALGVVVDDVVGAVDAFRRRLQDRSAVDGETSIAEIVRESAHETRGPALYGALLIGLALVPTYLVAFQNGFPGALFGPIAVSYGLAVLASLVIALTLTPVLTYFLYSRFPAGSTASPLARLMQRGYDRILAPIVRRPSWALAIVGALLAGGLLIAPSLGTSLIPTFQDRDLLIHWEGAPGTSLPEMDRITSVVTQELRTVPGVDDAGAHLGRALMSDQSIDVNGGEIWLRLNPNADYAVTVAAVRGVVDGYPGLRNEVMTYPSERLRAVVSDSSDAIVTRLYGEDFNVLTAKAEEIRQQMAGIPGVVDPHLLTSSQQEPTLQIEVDLATAQQYGVSPGEVRRAAATLLSGVSVGSLFDDQKVFEVVVRGTPNVRNSPDSVRDLLIDTPDGGHVRLGDVAKVAMTSSPVDIRHDSVMRYVDIGAGIRDRNINAVTADINGALAGMQLPLEYHAQVLGSYAAHQATERQLLGFSIAALIAILLLLQVAFNSWKLAGLAWLSLPAALTGGLVAAFAGGGVISLGALAGLIAVFGIAARSTIAQIRDLQRLEQDAGRQLDEVQLRQGASQRLIPVMTTALATGLAMTPLAILGPVAGNEILHPMALVVLGGLATATLVNLLVLPALYPLFAPAPRAATDWDTPAFGAAISPVAN